MDVMSTPSPAEIASAMRTILHEEVSVVAMTIGSADVDEDVFEAERAVVAQAVPRRRAEFSAGRAAARRAAAALAVDLPPLLSNPDRSPAWPDGLVGSISHCGPVCVAAVAGIDRIAALGIDVERNRPLGEDVAAHVGSAVEVRAFREAGASHPAATVFSCKESLYKAWSPLVRTWLGFDDVTLSVPEPGRFEASFRRPDDRRLLGSEPEGRFTTCGDLVLSSLVVAG